MREDFYIIYNNYIYILANEVTIIVGDDRSDDSENSSMDESD